MALRNSFNQFRYSFIAAIIIIEKVSATAGAGPGGTYTVKLFLKIELFKDSCRNNLRFWKKSVLALKRSLFYVRKKIVTENGTFLKLSIFPYIRIKVYSSWNIKYMLSFFSTILETIYKKKFNLKFLFRNFLWICLSTSHKIFPNLIAKEKVHP